MLPIDGKRATIIEGKRELVWATKKAPKLVGYTKLEKLKTYGFNLDIEWFTNPYIPVQENES
jgi:hypothetical protein